MADKSSRDKKEEHARLLYTRERLTQKEAARRAGVTEKTISKWIKLHNWEAERAAMTITKERQLAMMYSALNDINNKIAERPERERHATTAEADTIVKYAKAIERLETDCGVSEIISVCMNISSWLKTAADKVKEITDLFDKYIKSKLR